MATRQDANKERENHHEDHSTLDGTRKEIRMKRIALFLAFTFAALAQPHSAVPVVLVDGYDFGGNCSAPRDATTNFGQLAQMLTQDNGKQPYYFDYCQTQLIGSMYNGNMNHIPPAGTIGWYLGQVFAKVTPAGGQVDVIAYSTAGLFIRSYLRGNMTPPIRKLVLIGSPNFGLATQLVSDHGMIDGATSIQRLLNLGNDDVLPWSAFLWSLNNWNQRGDDLRGTDTVAIAGNGGTPDRATDGMVSVNSASLAFAFPDGDQRTRVLNTYCHGNIILDTENCAGGLIANVTGPTHPAYQIIRSFLDGTEAWKTIGIPPSQASRTGGIVWGSYDGVLTGCLGASNQCGTTPTLSSPATTLPFLQGPIAGYIGYLDFFPAPTPTAAAINYNSTVWQEDSKNPGNSGWIAPREKMNVTIGPGTVQVQYAKFVTRLSGFGIRPAAGLPPGARSVAADSLITIYGDNLAASTRSASYPWPIQLAGTSVSVDGIPCPLTYVSPGQVNARLPAGLAPGIHGLLVTIPLQDPYSGATQRAQDSMPFVIEPVVPALFSTAGNQVVSALHGNYQAVSPTYPAAAGETIALYATGLGAVTSHNGLLTADILPQVWIGGKPAAVSFAGRAPGYQGLDQINVQVPAGVPQGTEVPVRIVSNGRTSNTVFLPLN
jgi:uncharacterized protein (TIGR03437 family)